MPDVRALRSVQQQVVDDVWQSRHFENLIEEPWCRVAINGVFSCSQQYVEQQQELKAHLQKYAEHYPDVKAEHIETL